MTSKSLIALAFVCLAPAVAFAETAPAKVTAPAAPAAVTTPAPSAPAATVKAAPAATTTAPAAAPATAAVPADGQGSKRWKDCAGDVQKFCATVEKGKGAVRTCLESHSAELSPACKTGMAEHAATKATEKADEKAVAPSAPAADKVVK